jgi:hypothetical protein
MNPAVDNEFQQWLSQINQVCGNFTGRLLTERYTGVLDTHFAKGAEYRDNQRGEFIPHLAGNKRQRRCLVLHRFSA